MFAFSPQLDPHESFLKKSTNATRSVDVSFAEAESPPVVCINTITTIVADPSTHAIDPPPLCIAWLWCSYHTLAAILESCDQIER